MARSASGGSRRPTQSIFKFDPGGGRQKVGGAYARGFTIYIFRRIFAK